jgi:hypothetical protein
MSLKNVDIGSAMRRLAEKRIEDAIQEGKFDNLQGAGKPLDLEPMPAEEGARMMWWALRILKQNDVIPDEVRWRKAIDHLRVALDRAREEAKIRELVGQINELVHKLNTMGTNALKCTFSRLDADRECQRLLRQAS